MTKRGNRRDEDSLGQRRRERGGGRERRGSRVTDAAIGGVDPRPSDPLPPAGAGGYRPRPA